MVAFDEIGVSVLHGAFSTLLMVIVTAFGDNYIFKIFFKLFFGIIILGISHGLIVLPIILKFLERWDKSDDKAEVKDEKLS